MSTASIGYRRAHAWFAAFPCARETVAPLLPAGLEPVTALPGAGVLVAGLFDYRESTIGPYRSLAVGISCRLSNKSATPLLPLLLESYMPDVGVYVLYLAVSSEAARESAAGGWCYPTVLSEVDIAAEPDRVTGRIGDPRSPGLELEISRPGRARHDTRPLRTYSRSGDELLFTDSVVDGRLAVGRLRAKATLRVRPSPRQTVLSGLHATHHSPLEVRWFDEYSAQIDPPCRRWAP